MCMLDALTRRLQIFFYVGTFIGERLLYMPSLGFCLLLGELLTAWVGSGKTQLGALHGGASRITGALVVGALLMSYGVRTWVRNADWATEETLFLAALRVCPDSAKVRLNNGILARRYENWTGAIVHFRRAEEIEPGYCEPKYWIGITKARVQCVAPRCSSSTDASSLQVNQNKLDEGLQLLVDALDCKWVAVESAKVLQQARALLMRCLMLA